MVAMQRTYRGVAYKPSAHAQASSELVEHVYRGKRYESSLNHPAKPDEKNVSLSYRGLTYHQRRANASQSINS